MLFLFVLDVRGCVRVSVGVGEGGNSIKKFQPKMNVSECEIEVKHR